MSNGELDINSAFYSANTAGGTSSSSSKDKTKPQGLLFDNNNNSLSFKPQSLGDMLSSYYSLDVEDYGFKTTDFNDPFSPLGVMDADSYWALLKASNLHSSKYIESGYNLTLTEAQEEELSFVSNVFKENYDRYKEVSDATGIPPELICAIHYREGRCNFGTYLHNGQPLGKKTTITPKGKFFTDWTKAAIDAIKSQSYYKNVNRDFLSTQLEFAERYNGVGYRKNGHVSPYVWGGTDVYSSGMYVADKKFDPNCKDKRIGVAAILTTLYGEELA
ncbi:MAG: hypothetical protein E7Z87_02775 [Cyanobacteria bacterium SIG26]|nr:hypothetical protein [Cyanobacteria bacterium SIG26]